ncbi:hypothetical protein [Embleya sp. NPDC005575]|uniref:hypothetical protein n=1 Tax=Embleya sp. NPDC005575 TaxID=3156892 RepID=UPI0033B5199F
MPKRTRLAEETAPRTPELPRTRWRRWLGQAGRFSREVAVQVTAALIIVALVALWAILKHHLG